MNRKVETGKTELRRRIKAVLTELTATQIRHKSLRISQALFASDWWRAAEWVFCFVSLPGEVDTKSILRRAWADGKQVGIPRLEGEALVFHSYAYSSAGKALEVNHYGIAEPYSSWPVLAPETAPPGGLLVVCPGLAFDRRMSRLGRGGGYYDRLLGGLRARPGARFSALGVCFSEQLVDSLPAASHDQRLDALVCEEKIITPT
jgi:5-formyltetrahydrofolate cyclo-ligase